MPRQKISLAMIARDEERSIQQALLSARPYVQEIVVVNTGSSDRTVELAKKSGATVTQFDWCDDFAAARNAALDACTGDWVLSLDADEVLPGHSGRLLPALVNRSPAVYVPVIEWKGRGVAYGYGRLFPRASARWKFRICEEIEHDRPLPTVPVPDFRILHNPKTLDPGEAEVKRGRYRRMAHLLAAEHPGEPYPLFRAAQTIFSVDQADPEPLQILDPVLDQIPRDAKYGPDAYYIALRGYQIAGRADDGMQAFQRAMTRGWARMAHAAEYAELLHLAGRDPEALAVVQGLEGNAWDGFMDEGYYRAKIEDLRARLG